jgi:hypothetical protein
MKSSLLCLLLLLPLSGCLELSDSQKDKAEQLLSEMILKLRAANLVEAVDREFLPSQCAAFVVPSGGSKSGACITPMSIKGHVASVNLSGNYFGGGIRLLGGGSGLDQHFAIEGSQFDMDKPEALAGEDNAQDTSFDKLNTIIGTEYNYLDILFAIPRADGNEFWTLKYVFVDQPFTDSPTYTAGSTPGEYTLSGETVGECIEDSRPSAVQDAIDNNKDLLGGVNGAKAGDILVCRKLSSILPCDGDDFKWLNTSTNTFTSTRPSDSQVHHFKTLSDHKITCQAQDQGFSLDLGGFSINAELYQSVQFSAQIEGDSKIYEFQQSDDVSSYQKGSELSMLIDFDVRKSIFVHDANTDYEVSSSPDYSEFENSSDAQLLQSIWFKPVMVWQNSDCTPWSPGNCQSQENSSVTSGIKASINVTLKGETEPPVFVCDSATSSVACLGDE